ncbi:alpha-amylase family protein [Rhabdobacter roseus]|uniref:Glycosidase n=1 Tax=Rhabdobacter roseus TaxID=1655419 RepID=A0A840TK71_9BACT|nr:alpha-amylase family protein [Rhabdobacter roseus]MBB5283335.1 glycosidase [Rhabdobacter roseus]
MIQPDNRAHKLIIYQIFTRLFGNQTTTNKFYGSRDENGVGKFNDINDVALRELKAFGVTHIWYTGVIEHATLTDYSAYGIAVDHPFIVKGIAGSPYAVKDYYDVNPDLAVNVKERFQEFCALVERTHQHGMKVLIDFVPNHVARQYRSDAKPSGAEDFGEQDDVSQAFLPNNNFYYFPHEDFVVPEGITPPVPMREMYLERPAKATGNDVFQAQPSKNDWFETVKLNYGVDYQHGRVTYFDPIPSTWLKMRTVLRFWADQGVDGFRCDMAEMVPVEFWGWVIPQLRESHPDLIFIAEIYNPREYHNYLKHGHFDYLYDKVGLYDALRRLMEGRGTVEEITEVWQQESGDIGEHMLRFLENHDEQRIASRFFAGDAFVALPAMTLSATLHTGPVMIYFGQEVGVAPNQAEGFQGDDGRTSIFDYWGVVEFQQWVNGGKFDGGALTDRQKELRYFYQKLNHFSRRHEAIYRGGFYDLQYVNIDGQSPNYDKTRVYSYLRHTESQKVLCVYNFDRERSFSTSVRIPEGAWVGTLGLDLEKKYLLKEIFPEAGLEIELSGRDLTGPGVPLHLPPLGFYLLEINVK